MYAKKIAAFFDGTSYDAYTIFGAHFHKHHQIDGVMFTLYSPHSEQVEIVGDFNHWLGEDYQMKKIDPRGIYQLFVPNLTEYINYKYHILTPSGKWVDKSDPFAFFSELRPSTASKLFELSGFPWFDQPYLSNRSSNFNRPVNIYELHLGSWKLKENGEHYSYEELTPELLAYVIEQGFTHIELMPLSEYPFDGSWGYQSHGYFSMTSRYGNPKQLMYLIDTFHQAGIGVIFDFVPVHFVSDDHGLRMFDGMPVYESNQSEDQINCWGSVNFDYSKGPVRSFLQSAAYFYSAFFHVDGLRLDAVSHLIHRGGDKANGVNKDGIAFLRQLNQTLHHQFPSLMMIAEDSSDYPKVTTAVKNGGLGFDYKWDLGWMNDTLQYYATDPLYRKHEHQKITFSMYYFFSERFLLPLSHDEVVHGKKTIIDKMWGTYEQKFAQARNLYCYLYTHPGKKLLFMGNEIGHFMEWDEKRSVDWFLLRYPIHTAFHHYMKDLFHLYSSLPPLHQNDDDPASFHWIMVDNKDQSLFAYYRDDGGSIVMTILNMTPNSYPYYEFGVPYEGVYREVLNSEESCYGGSGIVNAHPINSGGDPLHGFNQRIGIAVGPFAAMILVCSYQGGALNVSK